MHALRSAAYGLSIATLLGLAACGMTPMAATSTALTARLAGTNEVPAVVSPASGAVDATLAIGSNVLSWTVSHSGLSGPATAAHFHGPALAGQNAGVVLPIPGPLDSPVRGSATLTATLTAAQAADLIAGKWYVNLHTAAHPGGEIRGQLSVRP